MLPRSGGGLPLLDRAAEDSGAFAYITPASRGAGAPLSLLRKTDDGPPGTRMPDRAPGVGEQYRFHVDMGKCIGCKCCVVACNEQNGNPAEINWRRVGELEGGWYPDTMRAYLSMGCNHCLEPTCLEGCPVDAYSKEPETGIVRHSADTCIGCQYCTWNCSYGVPQYNRERGVVGKCDMCHGRLSAGQSPACVSACPEGAIAIEIVNVADWRSKVAAAAASLPAGLPARDGSVSATRITLPAGLPPDARPRDITHVTPDHPHWPLVVMTVLTQLAVGAFTTIWLLQLLGASAHLDVAAVTAFLVGGLALGASTMHLGRPAFAYRALRMWRRSWLSREVLLFSAFSGVAPVYAGMLWLDLPASTVVGGLTVLLGIAGVTASACIYRVPSRPSWNTPYTLAQFVLTSAVLGPLLAAAVGVSGARWLFLAAAAMAVAQFVVIALSFFRCIASDSLELKGTARLLSTVLARTFVLRGGLLALGAVIVPLLMGPAEAGPYAMTALALAVFGELLGRYLFFVSAVPKHLAASYIAAASEAA
jgi:DMSO reductase iron-sulfur subunit